MKKRTIVLRQIANANKGAFLVRVLKNELSVLFVLECYAFLLYVYLFSKIFFLKLCVTFVWFEFLKYLGSVIRRNMNQIPIFLF